MKQNRIHLDKGNGMSECGKSIKEGMPIAFREGIQFFSLPLVEPIKPIIICGTCLKVNCPGIAKQLIARKTKSIEPVAPIAKAKPIKKAKAIAIEFPIYKCKANHKLNCDSEIPFDCQLCHRAFSAIHFPKVPIVTYKPSKSKKSNPAPIPAIPIPAPVSKPIAKGKKHLQLEKDPAVKKLLDVLFPDPSNGFKSDKGKVRELRQAKQLKVTNDPAIKAQFNNEKVDIELKPDQMVSPELMKAVRLNYSLRCIGMHPHADNWIITQLIKGKVSIISKIMIYKEAFAQFNRIIAIEAEKQLKAKSKKK